MTNGPIMNSLDSSVVESTGSCSHDDNYYDENNEITSKYEYDGSESRCDKLYNSDCEHQGHNCKHDECEEIHEKQCDGKITWERKYEDERKEISRHKHIDNAKEASGHNSKDNCKELCDHTNKVECGHQYEVGVVVVRVSSKYVHVVGPLGDYWVETCVYSEQSLVFVEGVRIGEVTDTIKVGTVGHMVLTECIKCRLPKVEKDMALAVPCLLWFGELRPAVRGAMGKVVGKKGDRMVVQLEGPSASRVARLVLFYRESIVHREIMLQTRVMVWAWSRQHQGRDKGGEKFLEGAAVTRVGKCA